MSGLQYPTPPPLNSEMVWSGDFLPELKSCLVGRGLKWCPYIYPWTPLTLPGPLFSHLRERAVQRKGAKLEVSSRPPCPTENISLLSTEIFHISLNCRSRGKCFSLSFFLCFFLGLENLNFCNYAVLLTPSLFPALPLVFAPCPLAYMDWHWFT